MEESVLERRNARTLAVWLDVAQALLNSGAEVWRVEGTLRQLAGSRGVKNVQAFTINSNITVTCTFPDGVILTQTRRIETGASTDMLTLERINALSRRYCATQMDTERLSVELAELRPREKAARYYLGGALAAGGFALFFGGGWREALLAAAAGLAVCLFNRRAGRFFPNVFLSNCVIAFLTGLGIDLVGLLLPRLRPDKASIGVIMLLIPGIAITNSIREIILGDTISGVLKFVESIFATIGIAIGFVAAMLLTGGAG